MRRCTKCGETKPLSEFNTQIVRGAWGEHTYLTAACGSCCTARKDRWVQANRERYLAYQREYRRRRRAEQAGSA